MHIPELWCPRLDFNQRPVASEATALYVLRHAGITGAGTVRLLAAEFPFTGITWWARKDSNFQPSYP